MLDMRVTKIELLSLRNSVYNEKRGLWINNNDLLKLPLRSVPIKRISSLIPRNR